MSRLANFDVSRGLANPTARIAARLGFGMLCALAMISVRSFTDIWLPGVAPFALVYPAVLLATLYGRWHAGAVAYVLCFLWAWSHVLPQRPTYAPGSFEAIGAISLNAVSALIVLLFAETFRAAVDTGRKLREAEIERGAVLLAELEHRTKNNFALVASLLELQKRREDSDAVRAAFDDAIGRVRTFAEAYTHLAGEQGEGTEVDMQPYLERLVARVSRAMLPPQVRITSDFADISLPREVAVATGLFTNEALANCAKYAFPGGQAGTVTVTLAAQGRNWTLTVRDDGVGQAAAPSPPASGGIGTELLAAFARQAHCRHRTSYARGGCEVTLIYVEDDAPR